MMPAAAVSKDRTSLVADVPDLTQTDNSKRIEILAATPETRSMFRNKAP